MLKPACFLQLNRAQKFNSNHLRYKQLKISRIGTLGAVSIVHRLYKGRLVIHALPYTKFVVGSPKGPKHDTQVLTFKASAKFCGKQGLRSYKSTGKKVCYFKFMPSLRLPPYQD